MISILINQHYQTKKSIKVNEITENQHFLPINLILNICNGTRTGREELSSLLPLLGFRILDIHTYQFEEAIQHQVQDIDQTKSALISIIINKHYQTKKTSK